MVYRVIWCENKSPDWKVASIEGVDGTKAENVSINRANKKGEIFPNFDQIVPGTEIEATLWTSTQGKNYLFAPQKPKYAPKSNANVLQAQNRKAEMIEASQDAKELGIKTSSTIRMAVDIVTSLGAYQNLTTEESIKQWREWLWKNWDFNVTDLPPF